MAIEIKAPQKYNLDGNISIFLAGSIEENKAIPWQKKITNSLIDLENIIILNPRRDDWDSSWVQSINNPQFFEQVTWELEAQEEVDIIAMYYDPETKSPITLLELGLFCDPNKLIVCCPEGFWRKGNVDIVCRRYNIMQSKNIDELIIDVKNRIIQKQNQMLSDLLM